MIRLLAIPGVLIVYLTLWDAFETMILPRRVQRDLKLTRYFYKGTWSIWSTAARRIRNEAGRESILSFYGPLSLILLLAVWAFLLILGFALLYRGIDFGLADRGAAGLETDLYFSGTTFFTLGLGDISASTGLGRAVTVLEAGVGFGFLALVIGYLPVLYQAFSRREVHISLLDARAGSPPTAMGLFQRYHPTRRRAELDAMMESWERWAAELLESHLSYPLLAYFRSQHDRQSWVAALAAILDANAVLLAIDPHLAGRPPQLAFAMARHAVVDLAQIFGKRDLVDGRDRLPHDFVKGIRMALGEGLARRRCGRRGRTPSPGNTRQLRRLSR